MDQSDPAIPQSLRPWPLGLRSVVAADYRDPEQACRAYRQWVPVKEFQSQVPQALFHQRVGHLRVNDTVLAACTGTPNAFELEGCSSVDLLICIHGRFSVETPQGVAHGIAGGAVLLPPGNRLANGHRSVVITGFQPHTLAAVAGAMAGLDSVPAALTQGTANFTPRSITAGPQASAIHGLLQYIDTCNGAGSQVARRLGLDDVLQRLVAGLLRPELLEAEPQDLGRHHERRGRTAFDELIDYIRANLDQPLRLSDLEARSFYSRRALQYAFRERLGTTPTAWIREQRLAKAKKPTGEHHGQDSVHRRGGAGLRLPARRSIQQRFQTALWREALGGTATSTGLKTSGVMKKRRKSGASFSHHRQNGALGEHRHHGLTAWAASVIHRITTAL